MAQLPSLFDRADGRDGREGIATPPGVILVNDNGTISEWTDEPAIKLRELVSSPEIERAEQCTITKSFVTDWANGVELIGTLGRGTIMVDSQGYVTRVLSSKLTREKPGFAVIQVVAESVSFDTPPDEFDIQPVEMGVHIIKHPRYFRALDPDSTDNTNYVTVGDVDVSLGDIKRSIIRSIQAYMDAPFYPSGDQTNGLIQNNILFGLQNDFYYVNVPALGVDPDDDELNNGQIWDGDLDNMPPGSYEYLTVKVPSTAPGILLAKAAALEIINKIWRQEEQPYVVGYQLSWASYHFRPPSLSPGGCIDDPIIGGSVEIPEYFISDYYPPDRTHLILDYIPMYNPQCYSLSGEILDRRGTYNVDYKISWLRKADQIEYQRTWFKLTRTWVGGHMGMWDQQLYRYGRRPSDPSEYVTSFETT